MNDSDTAGIGMNHPSVSVRPVNVALIKHPAFTCVWEVKLLTDCYKCGSVFLDRFYSHEVAVSDHISGCPSNPLKLFINISLCLSLFLPLYLLISQVPGLVSGTILLYYGHFLKITAMYSVMLR